jgi:Icc-related predicted phosphoesterase
VSTIVTVLTATDLHQRKSLYDELEQAVKLHRPDIVALVGDFLDASDHRARRFTATECAEHLSRLASPHVARIRRASPPSTLSDPGIFGLLFHRVGVSSP